MMEPGNSQVGAHELVALQERLAAAESSAAALNVELQSLRAALQSTQAQAGPAAPTIPAGPAASELHIKPVKHSYDAAPVADVPRVPPPPPTFGMPQAVKPSAAKSTVAPAPQRAQSLENKIGSQWFARIGILALLLGVGWALKYALDNHWIHPSPLAKTISGLLLGAAVVLWSERFRRKGYKAFSYSLKAVGTGVLYLTLWAACHLFHLLPASVALLLMIAVTAWNATMALLQDAELLAVYALVGAVISPALLGSGGNHETFLFLYVFAVDAAVLWLLTKKPWQRLLLGSFPATVLYFIAWYSEWFTKDQAGLTALFVLLLSAPFVAVALMGKQRDSVSEGVLMPLGAASFLSLSLYSVLEDSGRHGWLPWIAVLLAGLYLLLQRARRGVVAEAVHLTIAIVLLTVAIPLKASGRWLTIAWLVEGVALLWAAGWVGDKAQQRVRGVLRWLGAAALALGVLQSLYVWWPDNSLTAFWNARFVTEMCAVAALALAALIARRALAREAGRGWSFIQVASSLSTHIFAVLAVSRELTIFWSSGVLATAATAAYRGELSELSTAALLMVYGAALLWWLTRPAPDAAAAPAVKQHPSHVWLASVYVAFGLLVMLVEPSTDTAEPLHMLFNLRLALELAGVASLLVAAWCARRAMPEKTVAGPAGTLAAVCVVAANLLAVMAGVHEIIGYFGAMASGEAALAEAFTISAWLMVYAAGLLCAGFVRKTAFLRWQGLLLLVFTIAKVFLYDMRTLSTGYRILSFLGLGALLMGVSFAYQRDWLHLREVEAPVSEASVAEPPTDEVAAK